MNCFIGITQNSKNVFGLKANFFTCKFDVFGFKHVTYLGCDKNFDKCNMNFSSLHVKNEKNKTKQNNAVT